MGNLLTEHKALGGIQRADWTTNKRRLREDGVVPVNRLRQLNRDHRGNVAVIFALALVPIMFLIGMTIDYSAASQIGAKLQAAADAAALAAVTPGMLNQSDQASITAAKNAFNAQIASISGLNYSSKNLSVQVVDSGLTRTVTVSYSASSQNVAPNILRRRRGRSPAHR